MKGATGNASPVTNEGKKDQGKERGPFRSQTFAAQKGTALGCIKSAHEQSRAELPRPGRERELSLDRSCYTETMNKP